MNLPNKLTISRFMLTVAFLVVMFFPREVPFRETIALALFVDPLADKIMVCSAFIAFVGLNWIPAWMVVLIVARELAITGLRLLAASKNIVLAAEGYGKHKTISQIVAIISILVVASYQQWGPIGQAIFGWRMFGQSPWSIWFTAAAKWLAVALTFVSGWLYLWKNRALYLQDV